MIEPKRYLPAVAFGGGAAGIALGLPMLGDLLRCLFCVGVMAGAAASMKLWLDTHRAEDLTPLDGAVLGAISGIFTGVSAWIVEFPIRIAFGDWLSQFYANAGFLPDVARQNLRALYDPDGMTIVMTLPIQVMVYGLMGAVGGFLSIQFVFPTRKAAE